MSKQVTVKEFFKRDCQLSPLAWTVELSNM
jgi:hypothetical protein